MSLPVLDLSLFTHGDTAARRQLAADLCDSLSRHGFVKLVNHGISDEVVFKLFELNRRFFRMSAEDKMSVANVPGPNPQRGWSRIGDEKTSTLYRKGLLGQEVSANLKDARQHFDQGAKTDAQYPNKWPCEDALPGFRHEMEEAFDKLESVTATIMAALETDLQVPAGTFLSKITHEKNASEMRLNHYPAVDIEEIQRGTTSRIWPHFDLGVITLLFQDGVGGLEFEDREQPGTFRGIECGARGEMVVNVSETLQRWTNNRLPAGLHRVNVPEQMAGKTEGLLAERYSIAYFCKADRDAPAGSLPEFVPRGSDPLYKPLTAIEYHRQRLQSAY